MKNTFAVCLMVSVFLSRARADQLQIKQAMNGMVASASYARVEIRKGDAKVFEGRTDKYGRLTVALPQGDYQATVTAGSTTQKAEVRITGEKGLKQVLAK